PCALRLGVVGGARAWAGGGSARGPGPGGLSPPAGAAFDRRQWRHQVRSARARIAAPGAVPLLSRGGAVVTGAVIRAGGHPAAPLAASPDQPRASPPGGVRTPRTRQTTLWLRAWAGV